VELDYLELALTTTLEQFVERCPFPFLVGADVLKRPHGPGRTIIQSSEETEFPAHWRDQDHSRPLVLAVHKVQELFPSMISVGRTNNNDVVIADVQVSKLHAYVRVVGEQFELSDAGSRNGTWVGIDRLPADGRPRVLISGERVRFGTLEFLFYNADACWQRLRTWKSR
jgi:hypothetical protein